MGSQRALGQRASSDAARASVTVEVEGQAPRAGFMGASVPPSSSGRHARVRVASIVGLFLLVALVFAAVNTRTVGPDQSASPSTGDPSISGESVTSPVAATQATTTPPITTPLVDQLPTIDAEHVDGLVMAWVDPQKQLHLRNMSTGEDLPASRLAITNLPPLPEHIHLLGAENATWLVDLEVPENSGELSNTVRMVRLGDDLDSYAFISTTSDQDTEFFVGSLWGPSMTGTASAPASAAVFTVARQGIVVATTGAESSVLLGDGLDPLPNRLGRIVAANRSLVVGIFCDDLGRCIGRVANWDGSDEIEVHADALAAPIVRLSPDNRYILTAGGGTWTLYDLVEGGRVEWDRVLPANETLTWSPDSNGVFWMVADDLVSLTLTNDGQRISRVRQVGSIGERLSESEFAIYFLK